MFLCFLFFPLSFSSVMGFSLIFSLVWYLLLAVGRWRMFEKLCIPGWTALIPLYADYILYTCCWETMYFRIGLAALIVYALVGGNGFLASAAGLVFAAVDAGMCWRIAKAFGHGILFTLGLIFLNPFFVAYLGLGPDFPAE